MTHWPQEVRDTIRRLNTVSRQLKDQFTARDQAVDLLVLASICHEHVLLIGPPGTAKTGLITRYCQMVKARGFQYLLSRFTEPSELYGPLDLPAFQQGRYHIRTDGMLPDAQVAFLDEIFQGSSPILNSLLTLINERVFHNGPAVQRCPLLSLIGASNLIPEDPWLKAFADRFLLRAEVVQTPDDELDDLLERGWILETEKIQSDQLAIAGQGTVEPLTPVGVQDLAALNARILEVELSAVRPEYSRLIRELRAEGVELSDRRAVKGLKLVAGAAILQDRVEAGPADFWPLLHVWARPEEAETVRGVVEPRLSADGKADRAARPVTEILEDLDVLVEQERLHLTDTAWGAHLMALNRLRRELLSSHPTEKDARRRVEQTIERGLQKLGTAYV